MSGSAKLASQDIESSEGTRRMLLEKRIDDFFRNGCGGVVSTDLPVNELTDCGRRIMLVRDGKDDILRRNLARGGGSESQAKDSTESPSVNMLFRDPCE